VILELRKNGIAVSFDDKVEKSFFLFCGKHLKKQKTEEIEKMEKNCLIFFGDGIY